MAVSHQGVPKPGPRGPARGRQQHPGVGTARGELGCAREPLKKGLRPHILLPSIASSFPGTGQLRAKATSAVLCHRLRFCSLSPRQDVRVLLGMRKLSNIHGPSHSR